MPKNVEGIKADPPTIFFSKTPAVIVNLDGEPIWSPIKDNDLKYAVNTNWDLFQHAPTNTLLPAQQRHVAEGDRRQGPVVAGRHAARQLQEAAGRRQLEGRQGQPARQGDRGGGGAEGVRQHAAGGADSADRRAQLPSWCQGTGLLWVSNTESDVFRHGQDRAGLLPRGRPLVLGARLHRTVDVRDAVAAGGLQEDPARARALARAGVGARHRSGRRSGAARADPADRARQQEGAEGARRRVPGRSAVRADRERRRCSAR